MSATGLVIVGFFLLNACILAAFTVRTWLLLREKPAGATLEAAKRRASDPANGVPEPLRGLALKTDLVVYDPDRGEWSVNPEYRAALDTVLAEEEAKATLPAKPARPGSTGTS